MQDSRNIKQKQILQNLRILLSSVFDSTSKMWQSNFGHLRIEHYFGRHASALLKSIDKLEDKKGVFNYIKVVSFLSD